MVQQESFKNTITGFILLALVIVAGISFAIFFAIDNNSDINLLDDPALNNTFIKLRDNLSKAPEIAGGQRENFEREVPTLSFGSFLLISIIGAGKIFTSLFVILYNLIISFMFTYLGISVLVLGVISTVLIIRIIFLAWRAYKVGE